MIAYASKNYDDDLNVTSTSTVDFQDGTSDTTPTDRPKLNSKRYIAQWILREGHKIEYTIPKPILTSKPFLYRQNFEMQPQRYRT